MSAKSLAWYKSNGNVDDHDMKEFLLLGDKPE